MNFSDEEIDLFRQWFNFAEDTAHPEYLAAKDYELAKKIYEHLGQRIPNSMQEKMDKLSG